MSKTSTTTNDQIFKHVGVLQRRRDHLAQRVVDKRGSDSALAHDQEEVEALTEAIVALKCRLEVGGPLP